MKTKVTFKDSFDNGQMSVEITGSGNIRLGMGEDDVWLSLNDFEDNPAAFGYDHRSPLYPYSPIAEAQSVSWMAQCCEVIGNIHDNPELLKTE